MSPAYLRTRIKKRLREEILFKEMSNYTYTHVVRQKTSRIIMALKIWGVYRKYRFYL